LVAISIGVDIFVLEEPSLLEIGGIVGSVGGLGVVGGSVGVGVIDF
jgi:hypothetical protein